MPTLTLTYIKGC